MATILYKCDTCEREISISENSRGLTVFSKCVITQGCKGSLYKVSRNPNILREDLDFPPFVPGLEDYTPRRAFYEETITISTNPWNIEHNLGVAPAVTVYLFDGTTNRPVELSPDQYIVSIVDKDNISISFSNRQRGIVHLVARSSVPRDVVTESSDGDLLKVSHLGHIDLALVSLINTDSGPKVLAFDHQDLEVEILSPGSQSQVTIGTYMIDGVSSTSPWLGWGQILLRKRRNFSIKNFQILDAFGDVFPNITSMNEIPNGTSFSIDRVRYRDTSSNYLGEFIPIETRSLFILLGKEPYGVVDKVRNEIIDVGELLVSTGNRFIIINGEAFLDASKTEKIYPRIEQTTPDTIPM